MGPLVQSWRTHRTRRRNVAARSASHSAVRDLQTRSDRSPGTGLTGQATQGGATPSWPKNRQRITSKSGQGAVRTRRMSSTATQIESRASKDGSGATVSGGMPMESGRRRFAAPESEPRKRIADNGCQNGRLFAVRRPYNAKPDPGRWGNSGSRTTSSERRPETVTTSVVKSS